METNIKRDILATELRANPLSIPSEKGEILEVHSSTLREAIEIASNHFKISEYYLD